MLHSHNSLLLEDTEKQEIATILVLHTAHFNGENSKALQLYFKYVDTSEIKTLKILKSWINNDYYNWIQYYNSETDNGKAFLMKFGLPHMARHMVNSISKSYFSFKLKDFEDNYFPNGSSYTQLSDKYKINWKLENDTIVVRERNVRVKNLVWSCKCFLRFLLPLMNKPKYIYLLYGKLITYTLSRIV